MNKIFGTNVAIDVKYDKENTGDIIFIIQFPLQHYTSIATVKQCKKFISDIDICNIGILQTSDDITFYYNRFKNRCMYQYGKDISQSIYIPREYLDEMIFKLRDLIHNCD